MRQRIVKRSIVHQATGKKRNRRRLALERLEDRRLLAAEVLETVVSDAWRRLDGLPVAEPGAVSYLNTTRNTAWSLDRNALIAGLSTVRMEFSAQAASTPQTFSLPNPDGAFSRFEIFESPIMEPGLAAQFPEIKTYWGQGIDDPAATLRFDVSPFGFHAQVLDPSGAYYVDPYWHQSDRAYISYYKRDLIPRADQFAFESYSDIQQTESPITKKDQGRISSGGNSDRARLDAPGAKSNGSSSANRSGTQLRTYRLANAATGEYTRFHGGTVAAGQAAIVTSINRVTGIYEKELSVRLVLVANNSILVYTDGATDPYSNNDGVTMLGQNQTNVDNLIGNANYDIGHVFSTGGGGIAGLGVVGVANRKAQGVTGSGAPVGDPFDVDYVAHEMGHQFGGNHTFNSSLGACDGNRSSTAAYEPGSGSTIMAYAGICGADNLQPNSDPYFHSYSFDEIQRYTTSGLGNAAAAITNTGNSAPRVYAGKDYVIPAATSFVLDAYGLDADAGTALTYQWEQRDLGPASSLSDVDNGSSPLFRSWNPSTDTSRTLPRLQELLNNSTPVGERLPATDRTLNFRAIVRDNFGGGGGVNTDDMRITVVNTGASFAVTAPNTNVNWRAKSQQTVSWNVANTSAAPINESQVDIWLSIDGGLTFPILLAGATPNDGSETVSLPDVASTKARIKVAARNSLFFDISNVNFSIDSSTNKLPTISSLGNVWIPWNTSTATMEFDVGDTETAPNDLVVSAFAANSTLVPTSRIDIAGSGAKRSVRIRPALGEYGETRIFIGVSDATGATSYETFLIYVEAQSSCQSLEDFDGVTAPALPALWSSVANAGTNRWATSATGSQSGINNVFIPNANSVTDTFLVSPVFTASSAIKEIRFQNSYDLESSFDGGVLEISIDGAPFTDVLAAGGSFSVGGYTSRLSNQYQNPLGNRQAWSGSSGGYIASIAVLPAASLNKNVQLRWRLGTDSSVSAPGWRVDTIQQCGILVPPIVSIEASGARRDEGDSGVTQYTFTLTRRGKTNVETTVKYAVTGFGLNPASADDFDGGYPSGSATFPVDATSVTLSIPVRGDILAENDEGFQVVLSGPSDNALIDVADALGLILNDDVVKVVKRGVYYRGSSFEAAGGLDAAIDTSKTLVRSSAQSQKLSFENLISTNRGINGLVFDIGGIVATDLRVSDFVFRMSPMDAFPEASNPPSSWASAPQPSAFVVTPGTATTAARIRIDWLDNDIANRWLQVKILANANTGLVNPEVYYLGHLRGETNGTGNSTSFIVRTTDVSSVASAIGQRVGVAAPLDLNKDGLIRTTDISIAAGSIGRQLTQITIPPAGSSGEGEGLGSSLLWVPVPGHVEDRALRVQPSNLHVGIGIRWLRENARVEPATSARNPDTTSQLRLEDWLRMMPSTTERKEDRSLSTDAYFIDLHRDRELGQPLDASLPSRD